MANFRPPLLGPCISSASILPRALFCSRCSSHENKLIQPGVDGSPPRGVVALDCEMLSCRPTMQWYVNAVPPKRRRTPVEVSVAAYCALVDYNYRVLYESHIWPGLAAAAITNWKGIRPREMVDAPTLDQERERILGLLRNKLVVANDIRHDFSALQIHLGRHILPANVRDTSTCVALRKIAGVPANFPHASLRALARGVLGRRVQVTRPHSPVEDAAVAMELYRAVEEEWERGNTQ